MDVEMGPSGWKTRWEGSKAAETEHRASAGYQEPESRLIRVKQEQLSQRNGWNKLEQTEQEQDGRGELAFRKAEENATPTEE